MSKSMPAEKDSGTFWWAKDRRTQELTIAQIGIHYSLAPLEKTVVAIPHGINPRPFRVDDMNVEWICKIEPPKH